ncbi:YkgJ family cysteine cluster protein [uncultured Variovorax sp.]|uniref:YkgJ family cysteine cluster protein n=1 Tax=uncultured Variovorax sp. TaxID=114708 RepID=UPI00260980A7|nr:YkgJ family cysteine cluster protein [uncultured Variovorax sp.]
MSLAMVAAEASHLKQEAWVTSRAAPEPELGLAALQRARLPEATALAESKLRFIGLHAAAKPLLAASVRARTATQRVVWLQRAASAWARPIEEVGACRGGCAHCCHVPVTISSVEADLLGRAAGRVPQPPEHAVQLATLTSEEDVAAAQTLLQAIGTGLPCPFLQGNRCSVYEHRPVACRTLVNLDDDDLLCRHADDGPPASVPYADARMFRALALAAQAGSEFADIRDFFPTKGNE